MVELFHISIYLLFHNLKKNFGESLSSGAGLFPSPLDRGKLFDSDGRQIPPLPLSFGAAAGIMNLTKFLHPFGAEGGLCCGLF